MGIEAVKNLLFAKKAMDLINDKKLEEEFLRILSTAPSNLQSYGNGFGVFQKLVLPQKVATKDLITSIVALELSDVIPEEGILGGFYYKVEGFEPWRVYLRDLEVEEEFEGVEDLMVFDANKVPQPLLEWLLDRWAFEYLEDDLNFTEVYELLFENLLTHAKDRPFETIELIKQKVEVYLKLKLYLLLKRFAPIKAIEEVLEKADSLNLNIRDEHLKFFMERYIGERVLKGISEEEAKEIANFVSNYNMAVGRYELMINLWELQNWAWDNKEKISHETLRFLGFA